ncbi:DUF58 domain-containing protein [Candidatus Parabeggiatoa sp. HSG14]|uniref:DUF58 domain-containing protein n=1 Tax=Candidatus Parabeggiatoa sp. HSG14 TaxID=3055593 RepID=UPI0025A828D3|nr:DUF58 domain-containing protein [Thiotrichales bacterium HSG14]
MKPTISAFIGLFFWLILSIIAALNSHNIVYWQFGGVILLLLALFDAFRVWRIPSIRIQRQVLGSLPLGVWSEVILRFHNPSKVSRLIEIFDDYPITSNLQGQPQRLNIPASTNVETQYRICPQQRGATQFAGVHLLMHSPWRFWKHYRYIKLNTPIRVYPNFAAMTKYALFAAENRLGQLGIRKLQRRGDGLEFHQLREYRTGDALRQIDWNATSRYKKLISKEYQDERDQQIIFLIDCGRRMLAQDGPLSHFDHTLNAILLLSYVALRQGDALGLMTFSGQQRWIAPRKGMNTINVVLNTVYDLQPSTHASDYLNAANQLMQRHNKRALIILISNLRDEDSDELLPALQLLRRKHLVLLASLQERILNKVLEQPVYNFEDALRYAATQDYLNARQKAHDALKGHGIVYLDTEPEQLPVMMVNHYLEIKRGGML